MMVSIFIAELKCAKRSSGAPWAKLFGKPIHAREILEAGQPLGTGMFRQFSLAGNRGFSHEVMAAMLVFQNKEMAAMMVSQTNPLGIELYFYAKHFFCFSNRIWLLVT